MLSSCAFSLALLGQQPNQLEMPPDVARPFTQLETMRRMLQRKIEEKRAAITGVPDPDDATSNVPPGDGTVTRDLIEGFGSATVVSSRADYVPGLAAIFDLTVNVKAEVVEEEKKRDTETPRASKTSDDEAWEEVASSDAGAWRSLRTLQGDPNAADKTPHRRLRFMPGAVDALKATILDTIWRFGSRLELERGERLAVVVEMRGGRYGNRLFPTFSPWQGADPAVASDSTSRPGSGANDPTAAAQYSRALRFYESVAPTAAHLVFQVSAEDLKAWRNGEIDRDDMTKRTRIQPFVAPTAGGSNYGWFNGAR